MTAGRLEMGAKGRDAAIAGFTRQFGSAPQFVARAPGRVNLIGDHTDYSEGFVLPMAIDREVWLAFSPRDDQRVRACSLDREGATELAPEELRGAARDRTAHASDDWRDYVGGVVWALDAAGLALRGFDGVLHGDVPIGAGLSSSAALELAVARALVQASGARWDATAMARACQSAENEWVGVQCGIMDQLVSAAARQGHCLLLDCRTLEQRHVPLPQEAAIVVLDTGTRRGLTASAYNERREQAAAAARHFGKSVLRDVYMGMLATAAETLDRVTFRRARHVVLENARTMAAAAALQRGDLRIVGTLMDDSHASLRDDFEVSTPELDRMVEIARAQRGCLGARMTGAGFGGCAVALVEADAAEPFAADVKAKYEDATGIESSAYRCQAADGASVSRL